MNIVKVTVRLNATVSDTGKYVWSACFDAVPTLNKIIESVKNTSKGNKLRLLLEILESAKQGVTSTNVKSWQWTNLVRVGGVTVGVIDYAEITVNVLEDSEKVDGYGIAQVTAEQV